MASQTPPSGTFAGRYTIERELGRGGTATVYLARDETTSTSVALKILRRELVESVAADRFLREFRMNAALRHPHIAPILDSGQFGADLYLVMPHMESGSLRTLLDKERQLSVEAVVEIVRGIGSALQHAHERGLIHRDVKPENILFSGEQAYLSDFGIARAVERVTGDSTTSSGIIRGTPAYMSPEQASGEHQFDGRSDQFSFACVVYEMLAGLPAFHGPTQESTIAMRFRVPPREISVYRPGISQAIERVIQKAMSLAPADRYANMGEFVKAFDAAVATPQTGDASAPRAGWRRIPLAIATAVAIAILAAYGATRVWLGGGRVPTDSTQVVVFPLESPGAATGGSAPYELFHTALRRWQDLHVVAINRALDALARRPAGRLTLEDMNSIAVSLGARRFVLVSPSRTPTSNAIFAEYRDVVDGSLHSAQLDLPTDPSRVAAVYAALADSMVLRGASDGGPPGRVGPRHLFATQAFIRAANARTEWNLARADSELTLAVSLDSSFSRGYMWLAQQKSWEGAPAQRWVAFAQKALTDAAALTSTERLTAGALVLLGRGQHPEACSAYKALIHTDSMSFAGWYGLAECNHEDHVVVRDARSPSRWRFRASLQQAVTSYVRAFQLIPVSYRGFEKSGFKRLADLLFVAGNHWTDGNSLDEPPREFWGIPAVTGDSITLVPWPKAEATGQRVSSAAPPRAVARLRQVFETIVTTWASTFPRSADVKEALAVSLEIRGEPAAIDTMEAAERLVTDRIERVRLAASRIAVQLKFGAAAGDEAALARVRKSADSLLTTDSLLTAAEPRTTPEIAARLAPIAAMTGRCALTGKLLRQAAPVSTSEGATHDVAADISDLEGYVSAGCHPADTHRRLDDIASRLSPRQPTEDSRWETEYMQLNRLVQSIVPPDSEWTIRLAKQGSRVLVAERDVVEGHFSSARNRLQEVFRARQRAALPGQVTADAVVPEARIWLMMGDTSAALSSLESALSTARQAAPLSGDPRYNTARLGFLIQAYALRALLLPARDSVTARQSASVAAAMWLKADPALQPTVTHLRELSRRQPIPPPKSTSPSKE
jgi:hypothetical protein